MSKARVIVCDDDPDIGNLCKLILQRLDYEVEIFENCEDALERIEKSPPDLILLDLWLPEMGGREMFRRIKGSTDLKHIPIVLFSANNDVEHISAEIGAEDFIKKPFDIKSMSETIQKHI